ncbi:MAG TPA: cell division protein ZapE [Actinobacteria bacterium]|nr:cell division protein ZapE [Actinomycetota bacterium]
MSRVPPWAGGEGAALGDAPTNRLAPVSLTSRRPELDVSRMLEDFVPPPHFGRVTFDSYLPDAAQPSQSAAVGALRAFSLRMGQPTVARRSLFRRAAPPEGRAGVYLDGGFGVGKTHLLASLWHAAPGPKRFGTFVEYTNLVGALGFRQAVEALRTSRLVCIDEFELDDPGDTVLMSTLLGELVSSGVFLAATSNTLPEKLGEGRFAAEDFLREIQGLSAHFDVLRIDGDDFRHRGLPEAPIPLQPEALQAAVAGHPGAVLDRFGTLVAHLATVHPSRYGALVEGVPLLALADVRTVTDQAQALRVVVLVDRLYDRDIPVITSGMPVDRLFSEEMLRGGYRKKYFRAISRLVALAHEGMSMVG